ncbi:MAG: hypothetical protein QM728_09685 [Gordonia sp. (in: high G+C Gram-positive bacteria)]|uniref:hypothetical protein n=1 Tax=Gordonia sp. (in: high G+C Gram-positive bacteria) TaxID=84139 RepID=UPI0039E32EA8
MRAPITLAAAAIVAAGAMTGTAAPSDAAGEAIWYTVSAATDTVTVTYGGVTQKMSLGYAGPDDGYTTSFPRPTSGPRKPQFLSVTGSTSQTCEISKANRDLFNDAEVLAKVTSSSTATCRA